jgi:hypothetical protein
MIHTTLPGPCQTVRAFAPFGMTPFASSRFVKGEALPKVAIVTTKHKKTRSIIYIIEKKKISRNLYFSIL